MRIIPVEKLEPGDILGKTLRDEQGHVLLQAGVPLTLSYIRRLIAKGFTQMMVRSPDEQVEVEPDESLSVETRATAVKDLHATNETLNRELSSLRGAGPAKVRDACESKTIQTLMGNDGALARLTSSVEGIVSDVMTRSTLSGLTTLKCEDSKILDHSVDVCVVSLMVAKNIGVQPDRLRQLALGCLVHDVGMTLVDADVTGRERISQHTRLGFELLKSGENRDVLVPFVALEHHEHQDGTGLPRGLVGSNTIKRNREQKPPIPTLLGEIAAIANAYDNMLSGTDARKPMRPDEVVQVIRKAAGKILNRELVAAFLRLVPVFPVGTDVEIRNGEFRDYTATVVDVKETALDRPVIALSRNAQGRAVTPQKIDLSAHPGIRIRGRLS